MLGKTPERVFIRDSEIGRLVDICALFSDAERFEVEKAQRDLFGAVNPGDAQRICEFNPGRENAGV